jgi:hypothetical protein
MLISYRLGRKIAGAVLGAIAIATVFAVVGYSDEGATTSDYAREISLALASYLLAALIVHRLIRRDSPILDVISVTLIGSGLSLLMKLIFLEGQNGIPAYIARSTREHSLKPFGDLAFHAVSFITLTTLLSVPFIALGVWICQLWTKHHRLTTARF